MAQNSTTFDAIRSNSSSSMQSWAYRFSEHYDKVVMIDIEDDEDDVSPCIFRVPKTLSCIKPDAYVPQLIALGPYHRSRAELFVMERHKYSTARRILAPDQTLEKPDQRIDFRQRIIPTLKKMEHTIRSCYHEFLEFDEDSLAWIIAIDGLFLLHFFVAYANKDNKNYEGTKLIQDAIIRDVMMLENQIPVILLNEIWKTVQFSPSRADADDQLYTLLLNFCEAQSPLKFREDKESRVASSSHVHLLSLMYHLIVRNQLSSYQDAFDHDSLKKTENQGHIKASSSVPKETEEGFLKNVQGIIDAAAGLGISLLNKLESVLTFIKNLPWDKICKALGFRKDDDNPKVEEIKIPSVSDLIDVGGVKFEPIPGGGGIRDIRFDKTVATLYLPLITLNANSEVILRNLVAYESTMPGSPVEIVQYVDLISGIIDTAEDSKLLKDSYIINSELPDAEIADIFNGMNKSNWKQGEMSNLAQTVRQINMHFGSKGKVRAYKAIMRDLYASWKLLTLLSAIFLLLMMALQSFCQVYECSSFLN